MTDYLTVKQVAKIFHRSEKTIRRWIRDGMFEDLHKVIDGYLIARSEVERLLKATKVKASEKKRVPS